jgi:hypothetical protein
VRSGLSAKLVRAYRRTGADLPGGDPRPTHGAQMEGWFWRFTDADRGRVVLALCGINRHADGDWATVAVAAHPGGIVRSAAVDGAHASAESFSVTAPSVLQADEHSLRVDLDDIHLRVELADLVAWPKRLGPGGVFSALPFLGQYWHPHVLGGEVAGELTVGRDSWPLDGADVYAEKNWGAGFPDWWWWGQAQGFADPTVCVAFGGGRLAAGPVAASLTGGVLRWGSRVLRFAPPTSIVRTSIGDGTWSVTARRPGWRLSIEADGAGNKPAVLPVPLPAERRNVDRDFEHLAGTLRLQLHHRGSCVLQDESPWAALEVGSTDLDRARSLGAEVAVPPAAVN